MLRHVVVALSAVAILAASGCSAVVSGSGAVAGSAAPDTASTAITGPSSVPASSASGVPSAPVSSPAGAVAQQRDGRAYRRTPVRTAIGDPSTADLCQAMGLAPFRRLGVAASFVPAQYPPACAVRPGTGSRASTVDVYGVRRGGESKRGKRRTEHGLTVIAQAHDSTAGNCARDLVADGISLRVNA